MRRPLQTVVETIFATELTAADDVGSAKKRIRANLIEKHGGNPVWLSILLAILEIAPQIAALIQEILDSINNVTT